LKVTMAQVTASTKAIDAPSSMPIATPADVALRQDKQIALASQVRPATIEKGAKA
jgi:hypothetical protein